MNFITFFYYVHLFYFTFCISASSVAQIFSQKYGLAQLSIGSVMRMVLDTQGNTDLAIQMKEYLLQGLVVPDELAIQCLEVALMNSVCSMQG